jgi:trans-2,3-dihydro-3-hydroxyanthranilate isomerase
MLAIAREFNLSETVFVLKPDNPAHSARIRIFTPGMEVPFAGHPTIGTAALLAELKTASLGGQQEALVILEETVGVVRVGVRIRPHAATFAEFDAPKLPVHGGSLAPDDSIAAALGLIPSEIGFANHRPIRFAAGNSFAFVPVASLDAISRAHPDMRHWVRAFGNQDLIGTFLYTRETVHTSSAFHARMFAPDFGIPEDPATGSAAVAFAGVVHHFDGLPDGQHKRVIEQGYEMRRRSEIVLSLEIEGRKLGLVRIGGSVVRVSEGELTI